MRAFSNIVEGTPLDLAYASPNYSAIQTEDTEFERPDLGDRLSHEQVAVAEDVLSNGNHMEIIGSSRGLKSVLRQVETVARTDATVLIVGETGTGKELIARAVHEQSLRSGRPFISQSCAALPAGLIESELLGHERGAFTGAFNTKIGRFEAADKGTLFLDEIGDLPLEAQPKLLRLLQEREYERLGSTYTRRADVRLVAATNQNLDLMMAERKFRDDLFYRLNVFPIRLPPLRERASDIPLLVRHFMRKFGDRMDKQIDSIPGWAMDNLMEYHWPGNIRELQNVIERAVILSSGKALNLSRFDWQQPTSTGTLPTYRTLGDLERVHITKALEDTNWKIGGPDGAAESLGLAPTSLLYRMRKFGILRGPE